MCLGGHLAFRCAFDKRIRAAVCYFATDIHSHTLGQGKNDDSLNRVKDISGELIMVRPTLLPTPKKGKTPTRNTIRPQLTHHDPPRSSAKNTPTSLPRAATSSARPYTTPT